MFNLNGILRDEIQKRRTEKLNCHLCLRNRWLVIGDFIVLNLKSTDVDLRSLMKKII